MIRNSMDHGIEKAQRFIVPTLSGRESFRPQLQVITSIHGRGEVANVRGQSIPLLRLAQTLTLPSRIIMRISFQTVMIRNDRPRAGMPALRPNPPAGRNVRVATESACGQKRPRYGALGGPAPRSCSQPQTMTGPSCG